MSDIHDRGGVGFVEAYPIALRDRTTGLFYTASIRQQESTPPGLPIWPPEDDPNWATDGAPDGKEAWHWYADNVGLNKEFIYFWELGYPESFAISDEWFGMELFNEYRESYSETFDTYTKTYLYSFGWVHFDISGISLQDIQRAELVLNLYSSGGQSPEDSVPDDLEFIVQINNQITDYHDWKPSPYDFKTLGAGSVVPQMTAREIIARTQAGGEHEYHDAYGAWGTYSARHVLPLNSSGIQAIKNNSIVGFHFGMQGTNPPTARNGLFVECDYPYWDNNIALGVVEAGMMLPSLRLWIGGDAYVQGEATINVSAQGNIQALQPPPLTHQAKITRDQS